MGLTRKQRVFVEEYLKCWNATEAARRAGYSERSIRSIASENLTKPDIRAYFEQRLADLKAEADEVIVKLTEQMRGVDLTKYVESKEYFDRDIYGQAYIKGIMLDFDLEQFKADGYGPLIKKIKNTSNGIEVELYDGQFAADRLGRHHQLFSDKMVHEHRGQITHRIEGFENYLDKVYDSESEEPGEVS